MNSSGIYPINSLVRAAAFVVLGLAIFLTSVLLYDASGKKSLIAANGSDFREFYCAGEAVLQRADPYRVEPLRSCIQRVDRRSDPAWLVTPAPLPGYVLALSTIFAAAPFATARFAWEATLVVSVLIAALALARLTGWSPWLTLIVLVPTDGFLNLAYGELPPMVIAAMCVGALTLERGGVVIPAVCAGIALIEPHVGFPALIALLIAVPRARVALLSVSTLLAAVSIAAIGVQANVEYFKIVLPLQALAEVAANDQYSLTRVLAVLGASPVTAVTLGSASYLFMAAFGIGLAVRLANRRGAYLYLLPPAAVALGGSYIHDVQIAAALPVALLLAADFQKLRSWAIAATVLLLLPATSHRLALYPVPALAALVAMVALGLKAAEGLSMSRRRVVFAVEAVIVAIVCFWLWSAPAKLHVAVPVVPVTMSDPGIAADGFAPQIWGAYLRESEESSKPTLRYAAEKLPAWVALCILLLCAIRAANRSFGSVPNRSGDITTQSEPRSRRRPLREFLEETHK